MILNKKLAVAVSGAVLLMAGQIALADSTTDIVDALISKGVLTEEEGKLISKGAKAKADATPTVKEKDGAFILSSPNGKNSIQLTGRLHFDSRFNNTDTFDTGSNGNYPYAHDFDTKSVADHFEVRRARIGVKGRLGGIADYEIVGNFVGATNLDVAYLDINKYEPLGLVFGRFKVAPNLEIKTSSNNMDFLERSYVSQNAPEKRYGAALHGEFTGLTYFGSVFQNNDSALSMKDNTLSTAGRATANFSEIMGNKDMIAHVGLNGYSSNYEINTATSGNTSGIEEKTTRGTVFSFASGGRGLANAYRMQIAGQQPGSVAAGATGDSAGYGILSPNTSSVHNDNLGLEAIMAYNNVKLQGEYSRAYYKAHDHSAAADMEADVNTWYGEALWIMTGEKYSDSYKKGAFGSLKPKNEFNFDTGSGYGLWELGFRVDSFKVGDTVSTGSSSSRFQGATQNLTSGKIDECTSSNRGDCDGGAKSYTAGLKWVMNPNMLIKGSYTYTDFDNGFYRVDIGSKVNGVRSTTSTSGVTNSLKLIDHENLLMIRGQYMF